MYPRFQADFCKIRGFARPQTPIYDLNPQSLSIFSQLRAIESIKSQFFETLNGKSLPSPASIGRRAIATP